jgi:hypothetical protein
MFFSRTDLLNIGVKNREVGGLNINLGIFAQPVSRINVFGYWNRIEQEGRTIFAKKANGRKGKTCKLSILRYHGLDIDEYSFTRDRLLIRHYYFYDKEEVAESRMSLVLQIKKAEVK